MKNVLTVISWGDYPELELYNIVYKINPDKVDKIEEMYVYDDTEDVVYCVKSEYAPSKYDYSNCCKQQIEFIKESK